MSVQDDIKRMGDFIVSEEAARKKINLDAMLSQEGRLKKLATHMESSRRLAVDILQVRWGRIVPAPEEKGYEISGGQWWNELDRLNAQIAELRNAAEMVTIDPVNFQLSQKRIEAAVHTAFTPNDARKVYDKANATDKVVWQELGSSLARLKAAKDNRWLSLASHLDRDRAARVNTPAIQAAQASIDELVNGMVLEGIPLTRQIVNLFAITKILLNDGDGMDYLKNILDFIAVRKEPIEGQPGMVFLSIETVACQRLNNGYTGAFA
jgi:hypothetical protein